jgi:hypothetical protein
MVCGKEMKVINNFHLELHNLTVKEYEKLYPNSGRIDQSTRDRMSISNRISQTGKKYSEASKKKMSETRKKKIASGEIVTPFMLMDKHGENNPAWGSKIRSEEEIDATRLKNSDIMSLKSIKNEFRYKYGKFLSEKVGREFNYRSSWELRFFNIIENIDAITFFDYECFRIQYTFNGKKKYYIPDFYLEVKDSNRLFVEVGPSKFKIYPDKKTIAKFEAMLKYCIENNMLFVIVTEKELEELEGMENSINCWKNLKPFFHNIVGNDKCDG